MTTNSEPIPIPLEVQTWIRQKREQQREIEARIAGALEVLTIGRQGVYRLSADQTRLEPVGPASAAGGGEQ